MHTQFIYAVVNDIGECLNVRANKGRAIECLHHERTQGVRCKLVYEVTTPSGVSSETDVIGFDDPIPEGE